MRARKALKTLSAFRNALSHVLEENCRLKRELSEAEDRNCRQVGMLDRLREERDMLHDRLREKA